MRARNASNVSASSGAEPETNRRIVRQHSRRERRLGEQARIERGHAHHHGRPRQQRAHFARVEPRQPQHPRSRQQRAVRGDEQTVHVIDRQRVQQDVAAREAPGFDEREAVRGEIAMREHRALRAAGGARRVKDAPRGRRRRTRPSRIRSAPRARDRGARPWSARSPALERGDHAEVVGIADDHARLRVAEEVGELGRWYPVLSGR